ncbi:MAG TPA: FlgD immunoglobulin-like domain containing protein, partial [Gemmatimonadales bacterium]|nr:FlgD immunoglobulin-like domain containing protein [Gemmatimonadales bacterium]
AGTARALLYLTATEVARNQRDSALAAARRLILLDPRYRPDETFPQAVIAVYQEARRTAPSVSIRASGDTAIRPGAETFVVRLGSATAPDVTANVLNADGRVVRTIFSGPIRDSVDVRWNGLDGSGNVPAAGRYMIVVTPRQGRGGAAGAATWTLRLPIELARPAVDTTPLPSAPPDSLFRPERGDSKAAMRALIPGLVAGVAIVALPKLVATGENASEARLVVGGAVTIAGIAAFFSHHPGQRLPENEQYNRNLRENWQRNSQEIARRNADRQRQSRMIIRPGAPSLVTSETP